MSDPTNPILSESISALRLSPEFKEMAHNNGIEKLEQLIEFQIEELKGFVGFDNRILAEYLSFLSKHHLDHLIND